jgi:hypothetical protein
MIFNVTFFLVKNVCMSCFIIGVQQRSTDRMLEVFQEFIPMLRIELVFRPGLQLCAFWLWPAGQFPTPPKNPAILSGNFLAPHL